MSLSVDALKQAAAAEAVEAVESGMVVGLGTGSTAVHAVRGIGQRLQDGRLHNIVAIPTSERTAAEAERWAIPLTTLTAHPRIDLTVDGADEADPALNLIKGLGGALLREKIVASVSERFIVIGDLSKDVAQLGSRAPVPVEVVPFAQQPVTNYLHRLGGRVSLRQWQDQTFITDEGNIILDYHMGLIEDAYALAQAIRQQPGVVEHGLFLDMATTVILAGPNGLQIRHRA